MSDILLSICIPTYNRSGLLRQSLEQLLPQTEAEPEVEIICSDNASSDDTAGVLREVAARASQFRILMQPQNLGTERNIIELARQARGKYLWFIPDDDFIMPGALPRIVALLRRDVDGIVCNFEMRSRDMQTLLKLRRFRNRGPEVTSRADLMARFGVELSYFGSFIQRRNWFLAAAEQAGPYLDNGFVFLWSVYAVLPASGLHIAYLSEPVIRYRAENSNLPDWYHYFVTGVSQVFQGLRARGYHPRDLRKAGAHLLRAYVAGQIRRERVELGGLSAATARVLWQTFSRHWAYWWYCIPWILMPPALIRGLKQSYHWAVAWRTGQ